MRHQSVDIQLSFNSYVAEVVPMFRQGSEFDTGDGTILVLIKNNP